MTMARCEPSGTARQTGAAPTPEAGSRSHQPAGIWFDRRGHHDASHPRRGRRAGHHRAGRLPPGQGRVSGVHRRQRPRRAEGGAGGAPGHRDPRPDASGRIGLRRAGRAAEAGRDPRGRRHPADGPPGGDRSDPGALARGRRLSHQAVLAPGALAPGQRPAAPPRARRR